MAAQDEVLVQAQVLQHVLAAGSEHLSAAMVLAVGLLGELLAGDALGDVPHAGQAAAPQRAVCKSCKHTQGQTGHDTTRHSTPGRQAMEMSASVNRKSMYSTFLLLLSLSQCSLWTHHRRAGFSCGHANMGLTEMLIGQVRSAKSLTRRTAGRCLRIGVGHEGEACQTEDVGVVPAAAAAAAQVAVLDAAQDLRAETVGATSPLCTSFIGKSLAVFGCRLCYHVEWVPVVGSHSEDGGVSSRQGHQAVFVSLNVQLEFVLWFMASAAVRQFSLKHTHTHKYIISVCFLFLSRGTTGIYDLRSNPIPFDRFKCS